MRKKYPLELQMQQAKLLLQNVELNIAEIAYLTDFKDPRYFSRCFKKHFGLSPTNFRANLAPTSNGDLSITQNTFLRKAIYHIETNVNNPNYSPKDLAMDMNVSISTLYRRVILFCGLSPLEFIKKVKFKIAKGKLSNNNITLREVALEIGYSDVKYFCKCFENEFGVSPTCYQNNKDVRCI